MERYRVLFEKKLITEKEFWKIVDNYNSANVKFEENFCFITFTPVTGKQAISISGVDTMSGQEIKKTEQKTKELFNKLNRYDFEDITIQGPQKNQIFLVSDIFYSFQDNK